MVFLPDQIIFSLSTRKHTIFFLSDQKQTIFFLICHRQTFFFQDMFKDPFNCETGKRGTVTQLTQNICITFIQHRPNVFDFGPTLYKCYTNVLCLLSTCRHTIAYRVQADTLISATKLITRYYPNETLSQCYFNVRPTSATLAQHWTNIGGV